jgi:hypothetical protein
VPISVTTIFVYNDTIFRSLWWRYNQVLLYIHIMTLPTDALCSSYKIISKQWIWKNIEGMILSTRDRMKPWSPPREDIRSPGQCSNVGCPEQEAGCQLFDRDVCNFITDKKCVACLRTSFIDHLCTSTWGIISLLFLRSRLFVSCHLTSVCQCHILSLV